MVVRTFQHTFAPSTANPIAGPTVDLDVTDIEDAGIREVLQTPGAAYGAWSILDALLEPTGHGTPFKFREPLGQAREVKVALSGLFGRFVARAYLERYFDLSIFAHLGSQSIDLDGRRRIGVKRLSRGDLPDWVACASDLSSLTVAEAKGCHDVGGPDKALDRAWTQAHRVDIRVNRRKVSVKRIAIATRWGFAALGPADAVMSVRDPVDEGDPIEPDEKDALFIGLLRRHIANLIRPLGHEQLADALVRLTRRLPSRGTQSDRIEAGSLLDQINVTDDLKLGAADELVGGIVTRAGPLTDADVSPGAQEVLSRLNMRPVFVGVARDVVRAAIDGEPDDVRARIKEPIATDDRARTDRAGGLIIPLGGERPRIGDA